MNDEQRRTFLGVITPEALLVIEPLIDEVLLQSSSLPWDPKAGTWILPPNIALTFHEGNQLLAFVKFHEWREPRPGFVNCPECHIEFQATPIASRHHRPQCRVADLIKILQAKLTTNEGSKNHAES